MKLKEKFVKFWEYIKSAKKISLFTHVEPDGDTLGTAIALKHLIILNEPNKDVKISGGDFPRNLKFLIDEPIDLISEKFFCESLKIVVDTSTQKGIFDTRVNPQESLKLDHHPCEGKWLFEIGGDKWPATGQLLTNMIRSLKLKVNKNVLEGLAVAILTDTENFKERNVSAETFLAMKFLLSNGLDYANLLKKMQLSNEENNFIFEAIQNKKTHDIVTYIVVDKVVTNDIARPLVAKFVEISNTEVSLAFLKRKEGDYRCEIRSKTNFNVSKIATHFGGGGHFNSSGFIQKDLQNISEILQYINQEKYKK
ncbi:DHH family phosphoesterase [Metamycoplasma equirhinis]|uniref:DHH family phosphoesterase n=1 Tax=Metamycoplasma equirhinis TaxID=92402 RepID=UPI003593A602